MELDLNSILTAAKDFLPDDWSDILKGAVSAIPVSFDIGASLKFILVFVAALLGVGVLFKLIFGNKSDLNHALSSSAGILTVC